MLARAARRLSLGARGFASPLESTAKLYEELVEKSLKEFQANEKTAGKPRKWERFEEIRRRF